MSKEAAKHHRKASEHHTRAAIHHGEAAKHYEAGHHEKAAHHAHTASAHVIHAKEHADNAAKAHADEFRKEVKEFWSKMDQREGGAGDPRRRWVLAIRGQSDASRPPIPKDETEACAIAPHLAYFGADFQQ